MRCDARKGNVNSVRGSPAHDAGHSHGGQRSAHAGPALATCLRKRSIAVCIRLTPVAVRRRGQPLRARSRYRPHLGCSAPKQAGEGR